MVVTLVTLVVLFLAYVRLTLFIVDDYLFDVTVGQWLVRKHVHPHLLYLLQCPWCIGFWLAFLPAVPLSTLTPLPLFLIPFSALALNLLGAPIVSYIVSKRG